MQYSYEFKLKCVELYRQAQWAETPDEVSTETFRKAIWGWDKLEQIHGPEVLRPKASNKKWSPEEKFFLVAQVLAGNTFRKVAYEVGIDPGMLGQWVRNYKKMGYNGLVSKENYKSGKESVMKKKTRLEPLSESEREELIRLRAETKYLKAENAVIKKEMALRHEKWAAQLKAKKQQSLKNSAKKDIN